MPDRKSRREQRTAWVLRAFLAIQVGMLTLFSPRATVADTPSTPIRLVSSDQASVVIAFTLPDYVLNEISIEGQTFTQVEVADLALSAQAGKPQLPQISTLIGLPPTGMPELQVIEIEQAHIPLDYPICPAPTPVLVQTSENVLPASPIYTFVPDEHIYASDAFFPVAHIDRTRVAWLRDHRVARLTVHPMRYNPARGELVVVKRMRFQLRFDQSPVEDASSPPVAPSPAFEAVIGQALLNSDIARNWRAAPPVPLAAVALDVPATREGSYKIVVDADGVYQLTYADLRAAGLPVDSLDPRTLQLFEQGQEVAIQVIGQEDGILSAGDSILFYGRRPPSRYTDRNVYWLRFGEATGLRMNSRDVPPSALPSGTPWTTARYQVDRFYDSLIPAADGDHWYAASVTPWENHTASLTLMPPKTDASTAYLRVRLAGRTSDRAVNPDHHATFKVNNHGVGEWTWDGQNAAIATLALNPAILQAGDNSVTVNLPGDTGAFGEEAWVDAVELDYPLQRVTGDRVAFWGQAGGRRYELGGFTRNDILLYDVRDPQQPVQLDQARVLGSSRYTLSFADAPAQPAAYLALTRAQIRRPAGLVADAPSSLRDTTNGADYVIITHAHFASAVRPLAAYRQAQGLRVAVIDVQDIYDEFNGGRIDPSAIRDFIAYAYAQWTSPAPTYVLLVGDGSYDFMDHYGYGSANYVPPYLAMVDPWWGETAADNLYATVNGDDPLPDILLGRLPVTTAAEATIVVQKILSYERLPWPGDWNASHIFVADDADSAGDFATSTDTVYDDFITDPWIGHKIYLDDLPAETAQQRLLTAWNRGALLVSFVGHSSWHQWAVEALLDIYALPNLRNDRRWPVLLSMTCFTGFFHHPEYGTLDESLLRLGSGGAVATWSPSGLGVSTGHDRLYQGFYRAVFNDGQTQLGPATLAAKLSLYGHARAYDDLLDTYHLFGDPAMALNLTVRPWSHFFYLPIIAQNRSGG